MADDKSINMLSDSVIVCSWMRRTSFEHRTRVEGLISCQLEMATSKSNYESSSLVCFWAMVTISTPFQLNWSPSCNVLRMWPCPT